MTTPIVAPAEVVHAWREAAARAMHVVSRADALASADALTVSLVDALTHAAGILLGSVANATPGVRDVFDGELRALIEQAAAEQETDRGRERDGICPIPDPGGRPYRCTCGPTAQAECAAVAYEAGAGRIAVPDAAGDSGCEGGPA